MNKKDIMFFCALLESVERFAIVRTIDAAKPVLEIIGAPDYEKEMNELLGLIKNSIHFDILEVKNE
jgi:hypothetical protein